MTIGLRVGGQSFLVQPGQDEAVDGVRNASRLAHDGEGRALGLDEGPVRLVGGTLLDPALEQGFLARCEGLVRLGGGMTFSGSVEVIRRYEGALPGVPLDDDRLAVGTGRERELGSIQAELRLSRSRVGAVAAEAVVDENRTDVFVERDGAGRVRARARAASVAAVSAAGSALRQETNGAAAAATRATGRTDASSRTREALMVSYEG